MANTQQAGVKKDDHGVSRRDQQPQATSVAPDLLRAGVKGDDHGGCSRDQQPHVVDLDQFQAGAADRARNVDTTSTLKNCNNRAVDGGDRSSRIGIPGPAGESVILRHDDDPFHTSPPEPEFVLHTLRVKSGCIGDGDGFTAYVKKAADVAVSGSYKIGDTNNRATQQYRIRMRGIDAPELKMEHGVESRNELVKLIGGKCVTIHVYGTDQYGRYLGDIYCDGMFIQEEMLKRGFAWYFRAGEERPELARWEREAREARRGLWSSDNPQSPWEWKRDHPFHYKKESASDIQVELQSQGNESNETLPCMISKDMETLGRQWRKKLENFVADNVEQNYHLQQLKRKAEDRAKELEKEMESVVADNIKLNDQLEESKKNEKMADDRILKLTFYSESVAAVNMNLNDKLDKLKEKNKKAEDRAKESEKEMESVVAVNRELNDQLRELKRNKKVAEDRAAELKFFYDSVAAVNMDLQDELEELRKKNREAEDRAKASKKEMQSVLADNMKLNGQIQRLNNNVWNNARKHKKKLQSVMAVNKNLIDKLQELQKNNEKAKGQPEDSEKSEQAVETPPAPPAKDSGEKETIVWRKKTAATTSQGPPARDHCQSTCMLKSGSLTVQVE